VTLFVVVVVVLFWGDWVFFGWLVGFCVLRFELGVFTLSHSTSLLLMKGFFKIGSLELFAPAGFKP
jgi:hypothetical protein